MSSIPLAEKLRPKKWQDFVGQTHLLGENKALSLALQAKKPFSMIFWGPPGVGKTTLARLIATTFDCEWIAISAVLAGVKDIRAAVNIAEKNLLISRQTLLFIDEIHRFNKAQQDALLPFTESGLLTFTGATTENPSFEVNSALLSRAQVYVLHALTEQDFATLFKKLKKEFPKIGFDKDVQHLLIKQADGDARRFYNLVEQLKNAADTKKITDITLDFVNSALPQFSLRRFDKNGENFYDQISALHKSVRGSHPDAALYWLMRMLDGGADPYYLIRRMVRMAWEDVGLADPRAIQIVNDAAATYERLGSPEGELALAEAIIYLAVAAKSNAGYKAYQQALAFVKKDKSQEVPLHLRNAVTSLMSGLDYGKAYRYAHDEPYGYAAGENYLPKGMQYPNWYQPVARGLEITIGEKLNFLKNLDAEYNTKKHTK